MGPPPNRVQVTPLRVFVPPVNEETGRPAISSKMVMATTATTNVAMVRSVIRFHGSAAKRRFQPGRSCPGCSAAPSSAELASRS